jgi:hypothetical protein
LKGGVMTAVVAIVICVIVAIPVIAAIKSPS